MQALLSLILVFILSNTDAFYRGLSPRVWKRLQRKHSDISEGGANVGDGYLEDYLKEINEKISIAKANADSGNGMELIENGINETIYRQYPFEHNAASNELPILRDCNNYYSGEFGKCFWHQNADNVYVYFPLDDLVSKGDIKAKFEALKVTVDIKDEKFISFPCVDRIIPEGSFWVIEADKAGNRFLQLDLEKRFHMGNWNTLFQAREKQDIQQLESRSKMLEKLMSANIGMSKLIGMPPETVEDMLNNPDMKEMLLRKVEERPQISYRAKDGNVINVTNDLNDDDEGSGRDYRLSFADLELAEDIGKKEASNSEEENSDIIDAEETKEE
jgi:hypothetical protein